MMVATPIGDVDRYIPAGVSRIYWVETIANPGNPLRGELDAGVDLTGQVVEAIGWRLQSEIHDVQTFVQQFQAGTFGSLVVDDSRLLMCADRVGGDVTTLLSRGDAGYIVLLYGGDVAGSPMDVWPVQVASCSRMIGDDAILAIINVQFVVSDDPVTNLDVPS